tara:strand:+ start:397 stop:771 length:375 start_codon:yes stop_codon:yes gene_type:complete
MKKEGGAAIAIFLISLMIIGSTTDSVCLGVNDRTECFDDIDNDGDGIPDFEDEECKYLNEDTGQEIYCPWWDSEDTPINSPGECEEAKNYFIDNYGTYDLNEIYCDPISNDYFDYYTENNEEPM